MSAHANSTEGVVGRAKTVLVFHGGGEAVAVTTAIVARRIEETQTDTLQFTGPVRFEDKTARHIDSVIFPLLNRVLGLLGIPIGPMQLSAANVGGASAHNLEIQVGGFSAGEFQSRMDDGSGLS